MKRNKLQLRKSTLKRLALNIRSEIKTGYIRGDTTVILDPPSGGCQTHETNCPSIFCAI